MLKTLSGNCGLLACFLFQGTSFPLGSSRDHLSFNYYYFLTLSTIFILFILMFILIVFGVHVDKFFGGDFRDLPMTRALYTVANT